MFGDIQKSSISSVQRHRGFVTQKPIDCLSTREWESEEKKGKCHEIQQMCLCTASIFSYDVSGRKYINIEKSVYLLLIIVLV